MTNDRSTGVAVRVKLAGIGTGKTVIFFSCIAVLVRDIVGQQLE